MPLPTKANVTRPLAFGYNAVIEWDDAQPAESLYLRLNPREGRPAVVATAQKEDDGPRLQTNPEDFRTEIGQIFSRAVFSGGEGLDRAHRIDGSDSDFSRFWDSSGLDVAPAKPGDPEVVKLLKDISSSETSTDTNLFLTRDASSNLYMVEGSSVRRSANGGSTWATESPGVGAITGIAVLGDEVYVGGSGAVAQRASGGGWNSSWSSQGLDSGPWPAKGRVLGGNGNVLYELRSGAGSVVLHTLGGSGDTWVDATDGGSAILVAAIDSYVYAFAEEEGELVLLGETRIEGEVPTAIGFAQGFVFTGTGEANTTSGKHGRIWRSKLVGTRLRDSQLLREFLSADGTDKAPYAFYPTRDAMFTGVKESGTVSALWKMELVTGGVSRHVSTNPSGSGEIQGISVVDDRLFMTFSGTGCFAESATVYAASGYMIGPMADFYTTTPKQWMGARLNLESAIAAAGATVILAYSNDPAALTDPGHGSWTDIITVNSTNGEVTTEEPIFNSSKRWLLQKVTITRSTSTTVTPSMLSYSFRALSLVEDEVFSIPVLTSDHIEIPGRMPFTVRGHGELIYQALRVLEGTGVILEIFRPAVKVRGVLETVAMPIEGQTYRGSQTFFTVLTVRGLKV